MEVAPAPLQLSAYMAQQLASLERRTPGAGGGGVKRLKQQKELSVEQWMAKRRLEVRKEAERERRRKEREARRAAVLAARVEKQRRMEARAQMARARRDVRETQLAERSAERDARRDAKANRVLTEAFAQRNERLARQREQAELRLMHGIATGHGAIVEAAPGTLRIALPTKRPERRFVRLVLGGVAGSWGRAP